jgi:hypothetical protein
MCFLAVSNIKKNRYYSVKMSGMCPRRLQRCRLLFFSSPSVCVCVMNEEEIVEFVTLLVMVVELAVMRVVFIDFACLDAS